MEEENQKKGEISKKENKSESEPVEEKPNDSEKKPGLTDKMRENPWVVSTLVLGVLTLILLVGNFSGMTGNVVSSDVAGQALLDFAKTQGANADLVKVNQKEGFYDITLLINNEPNTYHVTMDGKYLVPILTSLVGDDMPNSQQSSGVNWNVFENELPSKMSSEILSFTKIETTNYNEKIKEFKSYNNLPNTLIVFYHSGCGWCTRYYTTLIEAQTKYSDLKIYALDLSQNRDIAEIYGVSGTPANIINGKYFVSGYMPIEDLSEVLNELK